MLFLIHVFFTAVLSVSLLDYKFQKVREDILPISSEPSRVLRIQYV